MPGADAGRKAAVPWLPCGGGRTVSVCSTGLEWRRWRRWLQSVRPDRARVGRVSVTYERERWLFFDAITPGLSSRTMCHLLCHPPPHHLPPSLLPTGGCSGSVLVNWDVKEILFYLILFDVAAHKEVNTKQKCNSPTYCTHICKYIRYYLVSKKKLKALHCFALMWFHDIIKFRRGKYIIIYY